MNIDKNKIKGLIFGLAIGDALGVPVEFKKREILKLNPITDMMGYGTYNQPPGTFSDDTSLSLCLAEALIEGFDLNNFSKNMVMWLYENYWTANGDVFDVGIVTQKALDNLKKGINPENSGLSDEKSNGNGSLMRISPLVFYLLDKEINERFEITKKVSSITHAHIRSVIACFYYLEFARGIIHNQDKFEIYSKLQTEVKNYLQSNSTSENEINQFDRLLNSEIYKLPEDEISSSGYVIHTLEASIWCLMTTDIYKDAVLKAVNLGDDSDTTGAVTGALAGLLYGYDDIPINWINQIAKKEDIDYIAEMLYDKYR